jgi:hypothetical protein
MWNDYAKNPDKALDWQKRYMNFMFDLEDSSGKIWVKLDPDIENRCTIYSTNHRTCNTS